MKPDELLSPNITTLKIRDCLAIFHVCMLGDLASWHESGYPDCARRAYAFADAMIAESEIEKVK